jgi:hypothetical protein
MSIEAEVQAKGTENILSEIIVLNFLNFEKEIVNWL